MAYKTIVQKYSLERGEVGAQIGAPTTTEHATGGEALLALETAIAAPNKDRAGRMFSIEMPDGRRLPFDAAYTEIFNEAPVKRDNRESLYPRLKRK